MKKVWLSEIPWSVVVETNRLLCAPKGAFHGPTSDGFETTKQLWNKRYTSEMELNQAIQLCRKCHRLAPFCNFNGNTFVAIIRTIIGNLDLSPDLSVALRSLAGHIVAGISTPEEEKQLLELIDRHIPTRHD